MTAAVQELPDVLTDEQMDELTSDMQNLNEGPLVFEAPGSPRVQAKAVTPLCTQDTGRIWKRTSGSIHKYGTIGGKPSITCNTNVTALSLSTTLYIKTMFGWGKVAGPFNSANAGVKKLEQKQVEYACKKASPYNHFRMVANGSVTYPGLKPIAGGAYSETDGGGLPCS